LFKRTFVLLPDGNDELYDIRAAQSLLADEDHRGPRSCGECEYLRKVSIERHKHAGVLVRVFENLDVGCSVHLQLPNVDRVTALLP